MDKEFNKALLANIRLKSKILVVVFSLILAAQIFLITYFYSTTDLFKASVPLKMIIIGPMFLLSVILFEIFFSRKIGDMQSEKKSIPPWLPFLIVAIECSFPTFFISFAGQFMKDSHVVTIQQLITSPPLVMYFVMIILSSLMLDFRISVVAGLVAGVEYFSICCYLLNAAHQMDKIDIANVLFRSLLIMGCGILAGFVSKKTKDAVLSSMEHKNALITKLDSMVAEKTSEVIKQKDLIEEKNKAIIDSIQYAKRIQSALMPSEKIIARELERLKEKSEKTNV